MKDKTTIFYKRNKSVQIDFTADSISTDGGVLLLEKVERESKLLDSFSGCFKEQSNGCKHLNIKMLKQRVFGIAQGYKDCNDASYLKDDPVFSNLLEEGVASQPTLSRFETSVDRTSIFKLCNEFVNRYVRSLKGRKEIIIDVDGTDDPTHGNQQLSLFNGYYGHYMYNELFFHDGDTGQIILPVLRPGNSHSNKWFVSILKRIIKKIKSKHPDIKIIIRADAGFSCPDFYKYAHQEGLFYCVGLASNNRLKKRVKKVQKGVLNNFGQGQQKHQHFFSFKYQAESWDTDKDCIAKVEWTGKGLNTRFIITNMKYKKERDLYFDFYVLRGDASENRIKEVKNMCYSDRLSNHKFWSNFLRLFFSSLAYELFLLIKVRIKKTKNNPAHKWQIDTIRNSLLKVGAVFKKTKRRIFYKLSRSFIQQRLFLEIIFS